MGDKQGRFRPVLKSAVAGTVQAASDKPGSNIDAHFAVDEMGSIMEVDPDPSDQLGIPHIAAGRKTVPAQTTILNNLERSCIAVEVKSLPHFEAVLRVRSHIGENATSKITQQIILAKIHKLIIDYQG